MAALDSDSEAVDIMPTELFIHALVLVEDEFPIEREDAEQLASTILRTTNICSQQNVKECKDLIAKTVMAPGSSSKRVQILCKYLTALAKSFVPAEPWKRVPTDAKDQGFDGLGKIVRGKLQQPPQPAYRRLHLLYIIHDLLLWYYKHSANSDHSMLMRTTAVDAIKQRLPALVGLAAFRGSTHCARTLDHVLAVLKIWRKQQIFDHDFLDSLYATACMADSEVKSWNVLLERLLSDVALFDLKMKIEKEPDWLIPVKHGRPGDADAPWHELPAANGLHMRRKHGYPLQWRAFPVGGYEIDGGGRRAAPEVISEVKHLHNELLHCFDQRIIPDEVQDVDALGNIIWKDPERKTRNHWGNSYDAVEKRRELAKHFQETCVGYEGVSLQQVPVSELLNFSDPRSGSMNFSQQPPRGFGNRGGYGDRGGFRNDSGGYGPDHARGGAYRGGYRGRGDYGGRGGRPQRGGHNGSGENNNDFGGTRRGYRGGG